MEFPLYRIESDIKHKHRALTPSLIFLQSIEVCKGCYGEIQMHPLNRRAYIYRLSVTGLALLANRCT